MIKIAYESAKQSFADIINIVMDSNLAGLADNLFNLLPPASFTQTSDESSNVPSVDEDISNINVAIDIINPRYENLPQGHKIKRMDMACLHGNEHRLFE